MRTNNGNYAAGVQPADAGDSDVAALSERQIDIEELIWEKEIRRLEEAEAFSQWRAEQ